MERVFFVNFTRNLIPYGTTIQNYQSTTTHRQLQFSILSVERLVHLDPRQL